MPSPPAIRLPHRLPRQLSLEVTRRCNFNCPYCYCVWHADPRFAQGAELTTDEWKSILDAIPDGSVKQLTFTGGEAFLRDDILDLARYAQAALPGTHVGIFTNAGLLDEERLLACKKAGIRLSTSFQGIRTYSAMTGTDRTYEDALATLIAADEMGWPMSVSMTITSANADEAHEMLYAVLEAGAKEVVVGPMMLEGRGRLHPELMLDREKWNAVVALCRRVPSKGKRVAYGHEMVCECQCKDVGVLAKYGLGLKGNCPGGNQFGAIGPDGIFRKCLHSMETYNGDKT